MTTATTTATRQTYEAAVFGATGAVGSCIVKALASQELCSRVVAVVRAGAGKSLLQPQQLSSSTSSSASKVQLAEIDYEELVADPTALNDELKSCDVAFCALGTTHGDAGGRDNFHRVDFDYVAASAKAAKAAGNVKWFGLVTSSGVSPKIPRWASSYLWTKHQAEKACEEQQFDMGLTVARPGLLERGDKTRFAEKVGKMFGMSALNVDIVAKGLVRQAEMAIMSGEDAADAVTTGGAKRVLENKQLKVLAKEITDARCPSSSSS